MALRVFYLVAISLFIVASRSDAYLDPGTSAMIIQVIIAIFVAGGVFWRSILNFFKKIFKFFKKRKK
jgi:O-antigen/teichoic acid export membrane protein